MSEHRQQVPGSSPPASTGPVPPSAAGHLEPYGARVAIRSGSVSLDLPAFLVRLLEDLARRCEEAGASVVGHLKCLLHTPTGTIACNLTSTRSGAACSQGGEGAAATLPPGVTARLDLAVLVYGLPASTIGALVSETVAEVLAPLGASWSITA